MKDGRPRFSIVVPTYGRPGPLATCLAALTGLDYPRDRLEVIVVDDGGGTPLGAVVSPFRSPLNLTLHRQANAGPAHARNTGASLAQGAYLAFTDDDCTPAPDWLTCLAKRLEATPYAMIGGRTANALPRNPFAEASQALISYLYAYERRQPGGMGFVASNNIALSRERFADVGGFDVSYPRAAGEDRAFCDAWRAAGHPIHYAPEAVIYHRHDLDLRSFWRQHAGYGRGAFQVRRGRSSRAGEAIGFEPGSFYLGLLRYPFSEHDDVATAAAQALILLLSQVATGVGFFQEALQRRSRQATR